jgi:hypothetical protein
MPVVSSRAPKALALWALCLVSGLAVAGPARGAILFQEGPNYHVIGYEAGGLPDGTCVGMVVLRVEVVTVSGQMKVLTTIEGVQAADGWSYNVVKAGGLDAAVEVDLFTDTCAATFKAVYKPGKTAARGRSSARGGCSPWP